jgi:hypothetical protein
LLRISHYHRQGFEDLVDEIPERKKALMKDRRIFFLAATLLVGIILGACSGAKAPEQLPTNPPPTVADVQSEPTKTEVIDDPTPELVISPTEPVSQPPPLKIGLQATNPTGVNLASGKPSLVEFFAFW